MMVRVRTAQAVGELAERNVSAVESRSADFWHRTGLSYPLYEVVSSGIANSDAEGFVTLTFDTEPAVPTVEVAVIHGDGTRPLTKTLELE